MTESNSKRKPHSNKFPLIVHKTRQYCKKIGGRIYYFGSDKQRALRRYLEHATCLRTGKGTRPKTNADTIFLKMLWNLYMDHQQSQAPAGELERRHIYDQTLILRNFVKFIGVNHLVSQVSTINIQKHRCAPAAPLACARCAAGGASFDSLVSLDIRRVLSGDSIP